MSEPVARLSRAEVCLRNRFNFVRKPAIELGLLLVVTLIGTLLRMHRLGDWSFWGDEEFTLRFADDGFRFATSSALIYWVTRAIGVSEWSARLVPALIGIVTIPILYLPVRRIFGKAVALLSSLLLSVSTWHLYWSQNVRFYTALLLLYSLALLTFFLAVDEDRPWLMLASLVFLGLAAKERLLALYFVPVAAGYGLLLWLLRFERPRGLCLRNLSIYLVPGTVLALFFAGPYILHLDDWLVNFGQVNNSPLWIVAGIIYYVGLPVICLGTLGALYQLLERSRAVLLLSLAAVMPVLALVALAPFHYTANRYAFVALTSWILLASIAIVELFKQVKGTGLLLATGVLTLALAVPLTEDFLYFQYQNGNRDDARAAFRYIGEHQLPGDVVVAANKALGQYYLDRPVLNLGSYNFAAIPPDVKRIWIVEDLNVEGTTPQQFAWIRAHAREVANFDVHVYARSFLMRVYLYEVPAAANR